MRKWWFPALCISCLVFLSVPVWELMLYRIINHNVLITQHHQIPLRISFQLKIHSSIFIVKVTMCEFCTCKPFGVGTRGFFFTHRCQMFHTHTAILDKEQSNIPKTLWIDNNHPVNPHPNHQTTQSLIEKEQGCLTVTRLFILLEHLSAHLIGCK